MFYGSNAQGVWSFEVEEIERLRSNDDNVVVCSIFSVLPLALVMRPFHTGCIALRSVPSTI